MTYQEAIKYAKQGKTLCLPNFTGFFDWDYGTDKLGFHNQSFFCNAEDLDIKNRDDFYYIT